jgi:sec-independent protein translocase protein TatA
MVNGEKKTVILKPFTVHQKKKERAMFGLGTTELIIIGVVVFLIFGAKRIPEIGKGLGGAIREFRQIKKDINVKQEDQHEEKVKKEADPPALEEKLAGKVLKEIPGVKQAMDVKEKVEKVKKIVG